MADSFQLTWAEEDTVDQRRHGTRKTQLFYHLGDKIFCIWKLIKVTFMQCSKKHALVRVLMMNHELGALRQGKVPGNEVVGCFSLLLVLCNWIQNIFLIFIQWRHAWRPSLQHGAQNGGHSSDSCHEVFAVTIWLNVSVNCCLHTLKTLYTLMKTF